MDTEKLKILVVDDEMDYCEVLKVILSSKGYEVDTAENGSAALKKMEDNIFDIVITDLNMPVMDGYELLKNIKRLEYNTEVLMLTAFGTIEKAVEAMKAGAFSYVTKGSDPEDLLLEIDKIKKLRQINRKNEILRAKTKGGYMMESKSKKFNQMMTLAKRAANSETNILILGESGSGKEVLASYIHEMSNRSKGSFMELNCQALSESILESELFGHEKGAFTGAIQKRIGHFEAANGGTLFLDEIGGVSMNLQAKMLKAIENKIIYRMGSSTPINVDFRLITATNRNLKEDMEQNMFRDDLFYRISTIVLELPPLRERKEDIPLFIDYFLDKYGQEMDKTEIEMDEEVRSLLIGYNYPGNIRELKNIVERLLVLSEHGEIKKEYLPSDIIEGNTTPDEELGAPITDYTESLREYRHKAEKAYIEGLIARSPNDMNKVAEVLSITRRQLFNKLVEFDLK